MMKTIPFLFPLVVILVISLPLGNAFYLSRWYTPTIPVKTSQEIYIINFEVRVEPGSEDYSFLPLALRNMTISSNGIISVPDNFWAPNNEAGYGPSVYFAGETLQQNVRFFDKDDSTKQNPLLEDPDDYAIIFVSLFVDPRAPGKQQGVLPTRLEVDAFLSDETSQMNSFTFDVLEPEAAVVVGSPLKGTRWAATSGAQNLFSSHRRAVVPLNPNVMMQRYAIDWLKFDENRYLYEGDGLSNEDWFTWGQPLYAPLAGTVTSTRSDLPDHKPFGRDYKITLENVLGNNVIVYVGDIGEDNQALYTMMAHMKQGSVVVEVGEEVEKGQLLGYLGNSGNSDAPHLHLHLSTCDTGKTCVDYPYVFEEYQVVQELHFSPLELPLGRSNGDAQIKPIFKEALPYNYQIVNFDHYFDDDLFDCVNVISDCDHCHDHSPAATPTVSLFAIAVAVVVGIAGYGL